MASERALVDFALAAEADRLNGSGLRHLKHLVLDTVAIALGAAARGPTAAHRALPIIAPSDGPASLWGLGRSAEPHAAAFVNATNAEVMDFQEVLIDGRNNGHAAAVMVPALLALAEARGASGRDLITALAVGLEVNWRLLRALGRSHRTGERGIRTTALGAPVATALAGARLIGADHATAHHALSLAASALPTGLLAAMAPTNGAYSADKDTAVGLSARHAVEAVLFAEAGIDAAPGAITGARGWLATYGQETAGPLEAPDPAFPAIERYAMKRYPANFGVQCAITATLDLRARLGAVMPDRLVVAVKTSSAASLAARDIPNPLAARFSLAYAVAWTWLHGAPGLAAFEEPAIGDAAVLAFMDRVEIVASAEFEAEHHRSGRFPARVAALVDGREEAETVMDPWSDLEGANLDQDGLERVLREKVRALLDGHWSEAKIEALFVAVDGLDSARDMADLTDLLRHAVG
jgi:2-methylcitrate dehydratase PrpD